MNLDSKLDPHLIKKKINPAKIFLNFCGTQTHIVCLEHVKNFQFFMVEELHSSNIENRRFFGHSKFIISMFANRRFATGKILRIFPCPQILWILRTAKIFNFCRILFHGIFSKELFKRTRLIWFRKKRSH